LFVPAPVVTHSGLRRRAYVEEIVLALEEFNVPVDLAAPSTLTA
jgi:hypothetical protein